MSRFAATIFFAALVGQSAHGEEIIAPTQLSLFDSAGVRFVEVAEDRARFTYWISPSEMVTVWEDREPNVCTLSVFTVANGQPTVPLIDYFDNGCEGVLSVFRQGVDGDFVYVDDLEDAKFIKSEYQRMNAVSARMLELAASFKNEYVDVDSFITTRQHVTIEDSRNLISELVAMLRKSAAVRMSGDLQLFSVRYGLENYIDFMWQEEPSGGISYCVIRDEPLHRAYLHVDHDCDGYFESYAMKGDQRERPAGLPLAAVTLAKLRTILPYAEIAETYYPR